MSTGNILGYTNWYTQQPDNLGGNQACVQLYPQFNFKWDDYWCDNQLNIICEKPCCKDKGDCDCNCCC